MSKFIVALSDPAAKDASRFGPKAANQAALAHADLPTPGGFCLSAEAYRGRPIDMVFALETQHGVPFKFGVRIEEMLIVHDDETEIRTPNSPTPSRKK